MEKLRCQNNPGFTLVELLYVLSLVSVMSLLTVPILNKSYDRVQIKLFFQVLEEDTLYIQNTAFSEKTEMQLTFTDDKDNIKRGKHTILSRKLAKALHFRGISYNKIIYNKKGKVETPRTITFYESSGQKYKVIFPFGTGREYIEKE